MRRLSAAEATATQAFEEVGEMRDELADLRERLAQARRPPVAGWLSRLCISGWPVQQHASVFKLVPM